MREVFFEEFLKDARRITEEAAIDEEYTKIRLADDTCAVLISQQEWDILVGFMKIALTTED